MPDSQSSSPGESTSARRRWRVLRWRFRRWWSGIEFALARRFGLATREDRLFFMLIPLVGILAGAVGLVVTHLIAALQRLLWGSGEEILTAAQAAPWWIRIAAPVVGGALLGLLIWRVKRPVGGHGTTRLLEAVALKGGAVEPRPVALSAVAGVFTVGAGGSMGREGPAISLGAMLASWLGRRLRLPHHRVKVLLGCGAAAGMAAIYNTPVGGALFAMEVILGNFALEIFGPVVVASVLSTVVARTFRGEQPIYAAPGYALQSGWELLAYAGLGIVGAAVALAFIFGLRAAGRAFRRSRLPVAVQPLIGMAMLGLIGLYVPYVYGNGFDTITLALHEQLSLGLLLTLPLAKLLATAVTAGSGGSGGLFTPSMFLGALAGGAYGWGLHALFPHAIGPYGAYAAVGMAAIAAGTSQAPISAILILFELTGNYDLILPLMLAAIISSWLARRLYPKSLYTESLADRGVDLRWRMEEAVLAGLGVRDLIHADEETLRPTVPYAELVDRFLRTRRQRLFVLGEDGRLRGAVSLHDIKHALDTSDSLRMVVADDLMVPVGKVLREDDRLHEAAAVFSRYDFERIPVLDPGDRYLGYLPKRDLLAVYAQEVLGRPSLLATFVTGQESDASRDYVELPPDYAVRLVRVPAGLVGKTLVEARLPQRLGLRVIEIKRETGDDIERIIPLASTLLTSADGLIVLGPREAVEALEAEAEADRGTAE
jgi:CIC family chloride channel protein